MYRWMFLSLALIAAWVAGPAGLAMAGGWAVVSLDTVPEAVAEGSSVTVGFRVLQHGQHPLDNLKPVVTLTHRDSGERMNFTAIPKGAKGHYEVRMNFRRAGTWDWSINAFTGEHPMPPVTVLAASEIAVPSTAAIASVVAETHIPLSASRRSVTLLGGAGMVVLGGALTLLALRPRQVMTFPFGNSPQRGA